MWVGMWVGGELPVLLGPCWAVTPLGPCWAGTPLGPCWAGTPLGPCWAGIPLGPCRPLYKLNEILLFLNIRMVAAKSNTNTYCFLLELLLLGYFFSYSLEICLSHGIAVAFRIFNDACISIASTLI